MSEKPPAKVKQDFRNRCTLKDGRVVFNIAGNAEHGVLHTVEISSSTNGAHLWILFDNKVPANEARLLVFGLLDKAMETYPNLFLDSYNKLFPNQDILPEGGFGSLMALSHQCHQTRRQ